LSGGRVIVKPVDAGFNVEASPDCWQCILVWCGPWEAYFRGRAGERFCVRNSGAKVVVEGVGEHGCEYMTGGLAVILGSTGQNFAAGMSGGVAYVYDAKGDFANKVNMEMVDLYRVGQTRGDEVLKEMVENHAAYTDSEKAKALLADWDNAVDKFVKVYPRIP
jgi:glutamate synthase (NADPH/NADH) large chain